MNGIIPVDAHELDALAADPRPLLIEFAADWCAPCRRLEPVLAEIAQELADRLRVVRIDADDAPDAVDLYGADGLPSLVLVRNGRITGRLIGWHEPDILRHEITMLLDVEDGVTPRRGSVPSRRATGDAESRPARELRFPDEPVGTLRIRHASGDSTVPAAGTVSVPAEATVSLAVVGENGSGDLEFLTGLPGNGLDTLALHGRFPDAALSPLAAVRELTTLLVAADDVTGAGLRHLAGAHALKTLLLNCPDLDDDGMSQLPDLPALDLLAVRGAEQLGDRGIAPFAGAAALTSLDLCAHRVTDAALAELLTALAGLEGLTLCVPDATDRSLDAVGSLRHLRSLAVEAPLITAKPLARISALPELRSLALYNCSNLGPSDLAAFTGLAKLRIENDDREPDEVEVLRLRLALPNCEINGSWYAAGAVQYRLAELVP